MWVNESWETGINSCFTGAGYAFKLPGPALVAGLPLSQQVCPLTSPSSGVLGDQEVMLPSPLPTPCFG